MSALPLRLALRELRGGLKGLRIFLLCLILGVGTLTGVGTLSASLLDGIRNQGQVLLGGDIEVRTTGYPLEDGERAPLMGLGAVSEVKRMRSMAYAPASGERTLVEIKAADALWPLYGEAKIEGGQPLHAILNDRTVLLAPELAARLSVKVGGAVEVGSERFTVAGILSGEPDKAGDSAMFGPTLLMTPAALDATGLIVPGSLITHHYRVKLSEPLKAEAFAAQLKADPSTQRWRVLTRDTAAPGLRRFIERLAAFLTLVGLTALLVGGVGVGNAVEAYLRERRKTLATLKVLGAESGLLFRVYLAEILLLAAVAVVIGLGIGAAVPPLAAAWLEGTLPVAPAGGFYPIALAAGAFYGVMMAVAFALPPLSAAASVHPARLFRGDVAARPGQASWRIRAMSAAALLAIAVTLVLTSPLPQVTAGFLFGSVIVLGVLYGAGLGLQSLAARMPKPQNPALRAAIANLHRPGAATAAVVMSLGLGLTLLVTIALLEANLTREVERARFGKAPSFFFLDIQKDQAPAFRIMATGLDPDAKVSLVPAARGPVTHVNGIAATELKPKGGAGWILEGDRGLTYAADIPEKNRIVGGKWWPADYAGQPLISLDARVAEGLDLKVGDSMTISVLGRPITARIANFREIEWGSMGFNFGIIFAPGTLEAAPHTWMAALNVPTSEEDRAYRAMTKAFPNVTTVRMKEVLETTDKLIGGIGTAVRLTGFVAILTGIAVLAGAIAAGQHRRIYDAVILKVYGAGRRQILTMLLAEFALLGVATAAVAAILGSIAAYIATRLVLESDFVLPPLALASVLVVSVVSVAALGLLGTVTALRARPNAVLRSL